MTFQLHRFGWKMWHSLLCAKIYWDQMRFPSLQIILCKLLYNIWWIYYILCPSVCVCVCWWINFVCVNVSLLDAEKCQSWLITRKKLSTKEQKKWSSNTRTHFQYENETYFFNFNIKKVFLIFLRKN